MAIIIGTYHSTITANCDFNVYMAIIIGTYHSTITANCDFNVYMAHCTGMLVHDSTQVSYSYERMPMRAWGAMNM